MPALSAAALSLCLLSVSASARQEVSSAGELARPRDLVRFQQQQVDEQRRAIEELRALLVVHGLDADARLLPEAVAIAAIRGPFADAPTLETPAARPLQAAPAAGAQQPANPTQEIAGERPVGPSLDVGPAKLRIGGYLGLTAIHRSTNSGGGIGTSFGSIPYEDRVQGNVSELRLSAQGSRISLRVDADFRGGAESLERRPRFSRLSGYFEMDFNGSTPGTVAVSSSSFGLRLRQAFAEVQYGETFFLAAGQAFSLMTQPKDQLSMWPSDVELSQAVDTNYLAGLIWDRAPQLRLTWRPSTRFNWGVSVENPEQQLGNDLVALPACCASDLEVQYNTGLGELSTPNLMPDFTTRVVLNPVKSFHLDAGGVVRVFRHTVRPYDEDFKAVGGGASVNVRLNPGPDTKIFVQTALGSGLGRYIGGLVPDVVFRSDGSISPIGTTSWVAGVEHTMSTLSVGGYYSGVVADEHFFRDTDGTSIGFGYPGAPNSHNRKIQEVTGTASYQIVTSADRGSAQLSLQASWVQREPWSVQNGLSAADTMMFFAQVRYNLP